MTSSPTDTPIFWRAPDFEPSPVERRRHRVAMTTEGTYPYFVGGVSSWCKLVIGELENIDWLLVPIVPASVQAEPIFELPPNAKVATPIRLWSMTPQRNRWAPRHRRGLTRLPSELALALLLWRVDEERLIRVLVSCRHNARALRSTWRSPQAWAAFLATLDHLWKDDDADATEPTTEEVVQLYQVLYWIAQTAAARTPRCELIHVTAAGWASIPALVDRALHKTPILVTEHGMYLREAYLGSVLREDSPGMQWMNTRIARSLSVAVCRAAAVVSPVTSTHVPWEEFVGTDPTRIRPIPNGVRIPADDPPDLPGTSTVVMVGRFDPLKDIHTALRTAAAVLHHVPDAKFLHYGPVDPMQTAYAESCHRLHAELGLGDRFEFMGSTNDVTSALRASDVVISTSISEGLPIAVLEAMAERRPVAATAVGGVRDTLHGCGLIAPPRDHQGLAAAVVALLRNPRLAQQLGDRSAQRVRERYPLSTCVSAYQELLDELLDDRRVDPAFGRERRSA